MTKASSIRLIQAFNDHYYRGPAPAIYTEETTPQQEEYAFIVQIIDAFIEFAKWEIPSAHLLKAELYREASRFLQCEETLASIDVSCLDNSQKNIYKEIGQRAKARDKKVFMIK